MTPVIGSLVPFRETRIELLVQIQMAQLTADLCLFASQKVRINKNSLKTKQ